MIDEKTVKKLSQAGIMVPEILLPSEGVDLHKWAVVACDQYTSEPEYWQKVEEIVGDTFSTLHMILPEARLESENTADLEDKLIKNMQKYVREGIVRANDKGLILVKREVSGNRHRWGLLAAFDLEQYSFEEGRSTLIRPSEETAPERLPPRIAVRKRAVLDLPHILVLIDDPDNRVLGSLCSSAEDLKKLYDFNLMQNGGRLSGYSVSGQELSTVADSLGELAQKGAPLYVMGDGNHSMAAAKAIWEENKAKGCPMDHALRWTMAEIVNIHDSGLDFEPIHRALFDVNPDDVLRALKQEGFEIENDENHSTEVMQPGEGRIGWISSTGCGYLNRDMGNILPIALLQEFMDSYLKDHPKAGIDYIHSPETVAKIGSKQGNIGFFLPPVNKAGFFTTIKKRGVMPRKAFSLGKANEKRYYMESRLTGVELPRL